MPACVASMRPFSMPTASHRASSVAAVQPPLDDGAIDLRLPYREPYDFDAMLAFYARRAIPGVEIVDDDQLPAQPRRSMANRAGSVSSATDRRLGTDACASTVCAPRTSAPSSRGSGACSMSMPIRPRSSDRCSAISACAAWPGAGPANACRAPGTASNWPCAPCLASRFRSPRRARSPHASSSAMAPPTNRRRHRARVGALFPTPAALADAPLEAIGLPRSARRDPARLAQACVDGRIDFSMHQSLDELRRTPRRAARYRRLDRALHRHARAVASRRVSGRRPRAAQVGRRWRAGSANAPWNRWPKHGALGAPMPSCCSGAASVERNE